MHRIRVLKISIRTLTSSMTENTDTYTIQGFGASVIGGLHQSEGMPNQDAWLKARGTFGHIFVVCDGVGSKPFAQLGAQAATRAVEEAVIRWSQVPQAPTSALARLIELFWRLRILPQQAKDCSTTVLFAYVMPSSELLIGGLGDGMVLLRLTDGTVKVVHGRGADQFVNQTAVLGGNNQAEWNFFQLPLKEVELVMLATDGVADDLLPEKLTELMQWFADNMTDVSSAVGGQRLEKALLNWGTPKSGDDKTLVVLSVRKNQSWLNMFRTHTVGNSSFFTRWVKAVKARFLR
jgi:serine/threonine protein phosphatase PrpC